ncbi:MAG TPA: hypothetical protein VFS05_08640 [Gemmatimonadaceae bacterium]|nr:hypothetical protein [Gemmatimonadaceae bacterium]
MLQSFVRASHRIGSGGAILAATAALIGPLAGSLAAQPAHTNPVPGDTFTVVHPPPGLSPIERAIRWFFSVPQWVQWTGIIIAAVVVLILLGIAWWKRESIKHWFLTRQTGWKVAAGSLAAVVLIAVAAFGTVFWNFTQHDNEFCVSCHTLHDEVYERFLVSEHKEQECHDCHKESMLASMMQVVKWISFRPEEVGPHAPVPTEVCGNCHIKQNPDSSWERIIATAGHRVHITSDTARKLDIQCVTCHGARIHRFAPVDETCGQQGCHDQVEIRIEKMRNQTDLHCTVCHEFARPVNELVSADSARRALVPRLQECFTCHQMRQAIENFDPRTEPHDARCGACHNPHEQETPAEAFKSCTNAGCHQSPREETPFHKTVPAATLEKCGSCHDAHSWQLKSGRCLDCHQDIFEDRPRARTGRSASADDGGARGDGVRSGDGARGGVMRALASVRRMLDVGGGPPRDASRGAATAVAAVAAPGHAADAGSGIAAATAYPAGYHGATPVRLAATAPSPAMQAPQQGGGRPQLGAAFSHRRHRDLQCTACHRSTPEHHGQITVNTPRECQECHHASPQGTTTAARGGARVECTSCHTRGELPVEVRVTTPMKLAASGQTRQRDLPFRHTQHRDVACTTCHTAPVTLDANKACADCHTQHHEATANCRFCHESGRQAHTVEAHLGCSGSGCHAPEVTRHLSETRNVCLSCHQEMLNHNPGKECASCHQVQWLAGRGGRAQ